MTLTSALTDIPEARETTTSTTTYVPFQRPISAETPRLIIEKLDGPNIRSDDYSRGAIHSYLASRSDDYSRDAKYNSIVLIDISPS